MIWGLSLHGWEDLMRGALLVVGAFGLIAGLATWFVVTLQREEIVKSELELEQLRTANLALEKQIQPRRLKQDEINGIIRALKGLSEFKKVAVVSYAFDVESSGLVGQLIDTLYPARMNIEKHAIALGIGGAFFGISITGQNKTLVDAMFKSFDEIGHLKVTPKPVFKGFIPPGALDGISADADLPLSFSSTRS